MNVLIKRGENMATFKGFAMKRLNEIGSVEKEVTECVP